MILFKIKAHMELNYLQYWGLKEKPFEENINGKFYFESKNHLEALSRIQYFTEDGQMHITMLTGAIGSGKTMVCDRACESVASSDIKIFFENGFLTYEELLIELIHKITNKKISLQMHLSSYQLQKLFENICQKYIVEQQKRLVIFLDECQLMPTEEIHKLRMLSNMGRSGSRILLILSGQPEFRQIIKDIPQLDQRIALRYHLRPLDRTDTEKYIHFRLMKAGCFQELFRPDCYAYLQEETTGIPRLINRHCKLALHFSAFYQKKIIDLETLQLIVKDLLKQNEVA